MSQNSRSGCFWYFITQKTNYEVLMVHGSHDTTFTYANTSSIVQMFHQQIMRHSFKISTFFIRPIFLSNKQKKWYMYWYQCMWSTSFPWVSPATEVLTAFVLHVKKNHWYAKPLCPSGNTTDETPDRRLSMALTSAALFFKPMKDVVKYDAWKSNSIHRHQYH